MHSTCPSTRSIRLVDQHTLPIAARQRISNVHRWHAAHGVETQHGGRRVSNRPRMFWSKMNAMATRSVEAACSRQIEGPVVRQSQVSAHPVYVRKLTIFEAESGASVNLLGSTRLCSHNLVEMKKFFTSWADGPLLWEPVGCPDNPACRRRRRRSVQLSIRPGGLEIEVGQTVVWVNMGGFHDVNGVTSSIGKNGTTRRHSRSGL